MKDLDDVKAIFLTEVDEETREDNEAKIREWETSLIDNENFLSWQESDITKQISQKAKDTYKELSLQLATDRRLSQEARTTLWGRQDACLWILSLTERDAKGALEQVQKEIKAALNTT